MIGASWTSRCERGVAFVEFALVLPLVLFLALGAVDLGRGFISYMELEQAAQEGALYGSFAPTSYTAITDRVRTSSSGIVNLADTSAVEIDIMCPPDVPAGKVGLHIQYTLELYTPLVGTLLGGSIPLDVRSVGTNFTEGACEPTPGA